MIEESCLARREKHVVFCARNFAAQCARGRCSFLHRTVEFTIAGGFSELCASAAACTTDDELVFCASKILHGNLMSH